VATVFKRGGKTNREGYYYVSWYDHNGKRRSKCARATDKAAAERIAAKLESDAALRRDRVIDPRLEDIQIQSRRTIESHLVAFEARLRMANRDTKHVGSTLAYIRAVCSAAKFAVAADIRADGVNTFAAELLKRGKSARTVQAYVTAIKGFARWLAVQHKLVCDPLASVQKPSPKSDRRRSRRMLLPDEWQWLRTATLKNNAERFGMPARERVLLYATAIQTGLRSGELRSVTRARLYLDAKPPFIVCKGQSTKNRDDARQYVQPDLANELRQHIATKAPQAPLFAMPDPSDVPEMLRADLADARREWLKAAQDAEERLKREQSDFLADVNDDGAVLDFHALRHTCGAWSALSGAHPKAVQAVMRHSTITLTMDTYGHLFPGQEAETVARLPSMMGESHEALRTTGTDDAAAIDAPMNDLKSAQRVAQRAGRESIQKRATACDMLTSGEQDQESRNPIPIAPLCDVMPSTAAASETAPCWTRTNNPLIKSQMLCQLS